MRALLTCLCLAALLLTGCSSLRGARATGHAFSRSILNIDLVEPPRFTRASASAPAARKARTARKARKSSAKKAASRRPPAVIRGAQSTRRQALLQASRRLAGLRVGSQEGFWRHVLRVSDLPITSTKGSHPERLLAHVKAQGSFSSDGKPRPGDLVFFRATELDSDPESRHPTLAGVVERVDSSGTVHFLSALGDTVDRSVLDPSRKDLRRDQRRGRVINSYLRVRGANDPPETRYLAGQLMLGFGRI